MTTLRRLAAAVALAVVAALALPGAAQAAGFQFWGFYHLVDGEWGFAAEGAGTTVPDDGGVDGWRFAVSAEDEVRTPRAVLEFDEICAQTPAQDGMKRVGVVIDPGRDVDAPEGETPPEPGAHCVVAAEDATSEQVLATVVDVRTEAGMICGVDGFPATECAAEVADPTDEQLAPDEEIDIPVAAPADPAPTEEEPTEDNGTEEEPTEGNGTEDEATEENATEDEATEDNGTDDNTTEENATDDATEENGSEENATEADGTEDDGTGENATDNATDENSTEDPAEENSDEESSGLPGWVWLVGVLVLVAILLGLSAAARNRRLEQAGAAGTDEDFTDRGTDEFPHDPPYGPGDR